VAADLSNYPNDKREKKYVLAANSPLFNTGSEKHTKEKLDPWTSMRQVAHACLAVLLRQF